VKGNTQVAPVDGPLDVTHVVLEPVEAVVVVDEVVEVVVLVVELVVELVLHGLLVQTGSPALEQTQVLPHSPVKVVPGVHPPVLPPELLLAPGHVLGQNPSEPVTWSPEAVTLVEHHGWDWSILVHCVYTTPLYLKGKTHC